MGPTPQLPTSLRVPQDDGRLRPLVTLPAEQIWASNPDRTTGRDDVCALPNINEAAILNHLRARFSQRLIYTWIARILICMNPFESRPEIYDEKVKHMYSRRDPRSAPPHLYAIAEQAFRGISKTQFQRSPSLSRGSRARARRSPTAC